MLSSIILKELRMQMRSQLYHVANMLYIILISCLIFGMVWVYSTARKTELQYAEKIFSVFFIVLTLSVGMICSAFAVNAISSEREKLTINLLKTTQLRHYHIFLGKLFSLIFHVLILLFASLPVIILIMPETDISIIKILLCYLVAFVSCVMFITIGLVWSSMFNTKVSAVYTYIIINIFYFGTLIIPSIITRIYKLNVSNNILLMVKSLNPFYVIVNIINNRLFLTDFISLPIWGIMSLIYLIISIAVIFVFILISNLFQKDAYLR